jgi:acetyl-CoA carboxylase biotin carboxyl carrier protein
VSGDYPMRRVREALQETLESLPWPPERLSVREGDVEIEVEWPARAGQLDAPRTVEPADEKEPPAQEQGPRIVAPSVGTFYRAAEPGGTPFVSEGDTVRPGQQVAIVEAMKLMLPVQADAAGHVAEVLKADGDAVEYGEPLFALAEDG